MRRSPLPGIQRDRGPAMRGPRCYLVLSASMGSGHDTVAGELSRRLKAAGHRVISLDTLDLLPSGMGASLRACYRAVIGHAPTLYAAVYRAFCRDAAMPRPNSAPLAALASGRLLRLVERHRVDVAGLPVIGYRPIPGHGVDGVRHMADLGLSEGRPR